MQNGHCALGLHSWAGLPPRAWAACARYAFGPRPLCLGRWSHTAWVGLVPHCLGRSLVQPAVRLAVPLDRVRRSVLGRVCLTSAVSICRAISNLV